MNELVLSYANAIRLGFFLGILILMILYQFLLPRRKDFAARSLKQKLTRWTGNLGILFLNNITIRLLFPMAMTSFAIMVQLREWGLLNSFSLPFELRVILAVVLLDLAIYIQHVIFHNIPLLWSFHRVHHTDTGFDVTTGIRFHPVEILISVVIKLGIIILIGPPALAVLIFEILLNATAMFNHSNIYIPLGLDKIMRWIVVTPDMHRIHHSSIPKETNSNYGFNIPWWDRIFGTYVAQPEKGHQGMEIGLDVFRKSKYLQLHWLLLLPFINETEAPDKNL